MIEPVIHDYLTQIFVKHYKMQPKPAAQEALRFLEISDLYGMQVILGEWLKPEPIEMKAGVPIKPLTLWQKIALEVKAIDDSGREPWLSREIQ